MNKRSLGYRLMPLLLVAASAAGCSNAAAPAGNAGALPAATPATQTTPTTPSKPVTASMISYDEADAITEWEADNPTRIELNGSSAAITGSGAAMSDKQVMILSPGVYVISGKLDDGQIVVDAQNKGTVRLVLNGATIHSADSAPIYVRNADKTIITLPAGTQNEVADPKAYKGSGEDGPTAAIYSEDDLVINGTGSLTVRANYNNGIMGKDELRIMSGRIAIFALDDGLVARDMLAVKDGTFTIEAGGDGIKSTNDTAEDKGFIALEGGTFDVKSGADGIQAETSLLISGGTLTIDAADDALHSNNTLTIAGGEIAIASGDDGIHADAAVTVQGGKVNITKSYEGVESTLITFSGGETKVTASDDGINVSGGNDGSAVDGRPGQGGFAADPNAALHIDGGYVEVDALGDGLDSNGSIYMTSGSVLVYGPTANNNGPLDYNGTFELTGGTLIAAGSAGMAQAPSEESKQYSVAMTFSAVQQAGAAVSLRDSGGNEVITFVPKRQYQSVVFASPDLKQGATYGLYQGESRVVEFPVSSMVTWLSESGVGSGPVRGMGPGGGGPGAGKPRTR